MRRSRRGVALLERVEAILSNDALYKLAEAIPEADHTRGGRPRDYPNFMLLAFAALISVYGSARQVEAELAHPVVWKLIRELVATCRGDAIADRLPARPMRRHHYRYGRDRYLSDPAIWAELQRLHREAAAAEARELGLIDPEGPGSWSHPHPSRLLYADGKVIAPLYRAKPGEVRLDATTGELRSRKAEPDGGLHFQGDGEAAWGTKFVLVAVRSAHPHGRVILDLEWVPAPGGEARVAMECFERLAPEVPGAQGVVYDTALRGTHHRRILRQLGLLPINRVTAASVGATNKGRPARRVEKRAHIEDRVVRFGDGSTRTLSLYSRAGAVGVGEWTETGEVAFVELRRLRTHRKRSRAGAYRWYNEYALPDGYGTKTILVRLDTTATDDRRRFNRAENVRAIAPSDPDFAVLYGLRNDAESINRGVDDSLYLGRAHSVGHARQLVDLLGFALMVNSLALHQHRRRRGSSPPLAA